MKTLLASLLAIAVVVAPAAAQDDGHANWFDDYDKAAAAAKEAGKDLLVDFTGSDWCGWCIRLDNEVFSHDEFLKPTLENYVLVALDFPRAEEIKAKVPNPERNNELQGKWGVQGFPTILLVTPEGEVFGRTGYQKGGPEKYVTHLDEIATKGKVALVEAKQLDAEFGVAADDAARLAVVEKALGKIEGMSNQDVGFGTFSAIARKGLELDAKNEKGIAERVVKVLLKAGAVDEALGAKAKELDPKNAKGIYETWVYAKSNAIASKDELEAAVARIGALFAMGPIKDKEIDKDLSVNMAFWNHRFMENPEAAKKYARRAQKLVGEDQRFQRLFDEILGDDTDAESEEGA